MRKTVKKIAALVAGTTMVGATIMGAMALDLSNYPAPFVTNGVFGGKIVVGSAAATSDVVGAIDVAASLQASATTTTEIEIPGAAGKATVTGDSFEFGSASDLLTMNEYLGDVRSSLLDSDLNALKSGVLTTGSQSTPVKQYLKFEELEGGQVVFDEDTDNDVLGDFLYFEDGDIMFEYDMDFTEGAESELDNDEHLEDLEGEAVTLLGAPYTIVEAVQDGVELSLTMLGGQVADTLRDGETKTYTIDGVDYEVTAVFISEDSTAKLSINGMLTRELDEGDTQVLGDGEVTVGVQEVLTNQREGIVEFYLGAEKLKIVDSNYTDDDWEDCAVEVAGEDVSDCEQIISATDLATDEMKINYIHYRLLADNDYYVAPGKGIKAQLEQPEGMLGANWDIVYTGLMKTGTTEIKFDPQGDEGYELEFTNSRGQKYTVPLVNNETGAFTWGNDDDLLLFTEPVATADPIGADALFIAKKDYFLLSDKVAPNEKAITNLMRYKTISESANTITIEEVGVGESKWDYTGTPGTNAEGTMTIAGKDHTFWVGTDGDFIAVDLDGSGALEALANVDIVFKGEGYIDTAGLQNFTDNETLDDIGSTVTLVLTTPEDNFDEPAGDETTDIDLSASVDEVHLDVAGMIDDPNDDDWSYLITEYGTYFKYYDPSSTSESESLTIEYPLVQRGAQVFVTAGVVEVSEGTETAGGTVKSTTLNPIGVGMAVLDTDAESSFGTTKMIVVGGPCVNTIAAKLMGSPTTCTEGFTPGKAIIKLFADQNALLVAGYNAQDTVGACYVLGEYKDYKLTGTEVEVVVADLTNIVVNTVG